MDFSTYSNEKLYDMAKKKDASMNIPLNNRVRLIRFLKRPLKEKVEAKLLYPNTFFIGLTTPRENLYNIIVRFSYFLLDY